jgi:hypothetical protein
VATQRGYRTRAVAVLAALLAALSSAVLGTLLAILGSHAATMTVTAMTVVPVGLVDALLGLVLVPAVRAMLRAQGIRPPRPVSTLVGDR